MVSYLILILTSLVSLYPMVMMVINSFKSDAEMNINAARLPIQWTLASYSRLFTYYSNSLLGFRNAVIVSVVSTISAVFLCALAAYAFTKYKFPGRNILFALLLSTMMLPFEIIMTGLFVMSSKLHLLNTFSVQILPSITPVFGLFFLRQYMLSIPTELLEAAQVDGAGHFTVFWRIMIPVSAPALGAYAILHFLGMWNAYIWPSLVAQKPSVQPIAVMLPTFVDPVMGFLRSWGTTMAGSVLATLPILIVFVLFQDKFMSSVTVGAVKG
jgi:multiple sugar transport system permease protein/arabinosaccharide transport system permease protein